MWIFSEDHGSDASWIEAVREELECWQLGGGGAELTTITLAARRGGHKKFEIFSTPSSDWAHSSRLALWFWDYGDLLIWVFTGDPASLPLSLRQQFFRNRTWEVTHHPKYWLFWFYNPLLTMIFYNLETNGFKPCPWRFNEGKIGKCNFQTRTLFGSQDLFCILAAQRHFWFGCWLQRNALNPRSIPATNNHYVWAAEDI